MSKPETNADVQRRAAALIEKVEALRQQIHQQILGQDELVDDLLVALLAGGHVLLEGLPGLGKTMLVKALANGLGLDYSRVQFTPDLMPSDVTGTQVLDEDGSSRSFRFQRGPIFAGLVLADEINRATPKTQSAMLEAMQERQVTVGDRTIALDEPYCVMATQNPVEQEGTYPLPEAQLDRFLFKLLVSYPDEATESRLLAEVHARPGDAGPAELGVEPVTSPEALLAERSRLEGVEVREDLPGYIVRLLRATREASQLVLGASPRAGVMLLRAAKVAANFEGRDYVLPDDVKSVFLPTLRHRVLLDPAEEIEGGTTDQVLARILDSVEVPR